MKSDQTKNLAYMAFYAALYVVLWYLGNFIPFKMADGGSVELEYVALFIASFHLGWKKGLGVAAVSWVLVFMFGGAHYFISVPQYCLDYFVPFIVASLACVWGGHSKYNYLIGVCISMILKWLSNVLSGVFFYFPEGSAAGSLPAWLYSISYNTWYNLATLVVCAILVQALIKY